MELSNLKQAIAAAETKKLSEVKIDSAFFPLKKLSDFIRLLKKHSVKIDIQSSFLNSGNVPDLVIEYSGPSTGRAIFNGQLYDSGELKIQAQEKREQEKREARELKEKMREMKKDSERVRKMLNSAQGKKTFKHFKYQSGGHDGKTYRGDCWVNLDTMRAIVCELGPYKLGPLWYEVELSLEASGVGTNAYYFFLPSGRYDSPAWIVDLPRPGKKTSIK